MRKIILLIFSIFLLNLVFAQDFPAYQDKYVNDFANILNSEQSNYLKTIFNLVEENSTAEIVFVSVQTCLPLTPNEYATQLGEKWGVGKSDVDNGLVLLYCSAENKFYVATGYGLEGVLPDSKIGRFLDEYYVPGRDAGNTSEGIISFSEVAANELILNSVELTSQKSNSSNWSKIFLIFSIIFVFIIVFSIAFSRKNVSNKFPLYRILSGIILAIVGFILLPLFFGYILIIIGIITIGGGGSGGRGFSSSGGGFSGGGFGGGSFGGGGAGR